MDVRTYSPHTLGLPNQQDASKPAGQQALEVIKQHTHPKTGLLNNSALLSSLQDLAAQDHLACTQVVCEIEQHMAAKGYSALEQSRFRQDIQEDLEIGQALRNSGFDWTMRGLQYIGGASQVASGALFAAATCAQTIGAGCVVGSAIMYKGIDNMQAAYRDDLTESEKQLRVLFGNEHAATIANAALDLMSGKVPIPNAPATTAQQLAHHFYNGVADSATIISAGDNIADNNQTRAATD